MQCNQLKIEGNKILLLFQMRKPTLVSFHDSFRENTNWRNRATTDTRRQRRRDEENRQMSYGNVEECNGGGKEWSEEMKNSRKRKITRRYPVNKYTGAMQLLFDDMIFSKAYNCMHICRFGCCFFAAQFRTNNYWLSSKLTSSSYKILFSGIIYTCICTRMIKKLFSVNFVQLLYYRVPALFIPSFISFVALFVHTYIYINCCCYSRLLVVVIVR